MTFSRIFSAATLATTVLALGPASAADADVSGAHQKFMEAFNNRQWEEVRSILAEDSVFHRANAEEVYVGADAVLGRFRDTIGNPGQWNVKFVRLDTTDQVTGNDGRVVERGDFAVTAGANDDSCYVGSFMMTWVPQQAEGAQLQVLGWQDVETDLESCK